MLLSNQTWWDGGEHDCEQGQARADEQADGRLCRGQDYTTGFFIRETKTETNMMTKTSTKTKTEKNNNTNDTNTNNTHQSHRQKRRSLETTA